ncbi:MAG: tetratricopeptide repeat protein [Acidimicrobiales bacterium]
MAPQPPSRRGRQAGGPRSQAGGSRSQAAGSRNQASDNARFRSRGERNFELPKLVTDELRASSAEAPPRTRRSPLTLERRLGNAAMAYERDRYSDALSAIKPVLDAAPTSPAARELHGLILYRMGRWRAAAKELREFHRLTGSFDQHPVIADCERAMGHPAKVRELWDELRREGVDREVLVEGRLVMAGTLADQGELSEAIDLLRSEAKSRKHADLSHLRQWYALADLYEQAGDLPRARDLFARVAHQAPDVLDAPERLAALC